MTFAINRIYHLPPNLRACGDECAARLWSNNRSQLLRGRSKEAHAIVSRLVNVCWYFFKVGLAVVLVGAATAGVYLYVRMDDEIRRHVEGFLAERYPQFMVTVGGARLVEGKGIAVYDIAFATPGAGRRDDPLLSIDELMLVCDVELATLVKGPPPVHRVEVKHPQASLRRSAAGRWNFEPLFPLRPCSGAFPQVVIRGGVLSVADDGAAASQPLALRDIELTVAPTRQAAEAGGLPSLRIEGSARGEQVKSIEIQASVDGVKNLLSGSATIRQLQINEALLAWARPLLPAAFRTTKVSGVVDGTMAASWTRGAGPPTCSAELSLASGRVDDPRLVRPVTDAVGQIVVDANEVNVDQLHGKWGPATVAVSLNRHGWATTAPIALSARVENVPLDEELRQTLATVGNPPSGPGIPVARLLREEFDKYSPTGVVDATLQASFDGQKWKPAATLTGRQLSFESDKFAYRLTDGEGTIAFSPANEGRPPQLDLDMYAMGGGKRLHILAQVLDPRPAAAGWAEISGEGLEIDERMIAALKEQPRQVIASLHPSGRFNLTYWRIERPQAGAEAQTSLRLDLTDVRINYDLFPYALREIRGVIEARGNEWTFSNLASGGRRTIYGEGYLRPTPEGQELALVFTGQNVPLDDNLFYALREPVQHAWRQLRPSGSINLRAEIRHRIGEGQPNIQVAVQPLEKFSLRPEFFPYLLDDVSGVVRYNDGQVTLQQMKATHDGTSMGSDGVGNFGADGGWDFRLTRLWADRLTARPDLLSAMPAQLSKLIDQLRPSGSFSLHDGELSFRSPASAISSLQTAWNFKLECHQTDLNCGIELHNIHGTVQLYGQATEQGSYSAGELDLETVTYQDVQFTDVRGPIWVDESQCRLGRWATEKIGPGQTPRRLTGNVYGGAMASDAWVWFGAQAKYGAEVALTGADLSRLIVERFGGQNPYQGKIDAKMVVSGEGPQLARLTSKGEVHIREADIYELPLLMSLLKVLRNTAPNKTAFNQSDIEFRIEGPHIYLDHIDFLGDVVDLYGYGETDFNQNVTLIFRGELGPRDYRIPLVKNLVGHASSQFMQMYVDGTLSEPLVTTEAFPGINQMLKQIRTDLEAPTAASTNRQANRRDVFGRSPSR